MSARSSSSERFFGLPASSVPSAGRAPWCASAALSSGVVAVAAGARARRRTEESSSGRRRPWRNFAQLFVGVVRVGRRGDRPAVQRRGQARAVDLVARAARRRSLFARLDDMLLTLAARRSLLAARRSPLAAAARRSPLTMPAPSSATRRYTGTAASSASARAGDHYESDLSLSELSEVCGRRTCTRRPAGTTSGVDAARPPPQGCRREGRRLRRRRRRRRTGRCRRRLGRREAARHA